MSWTRVIICVTALTVALFATPALRAQPEPEPAPATQPAEPPTVPPTGPAGEQPQTEPATQPAAPEPQPEPQPPADAATQPAPAPPEAAPQPSEDVSPAEQTARNFLAERFIEMAKGLMASSTNLERSLFEQSTLLLEAAARENPTDPRIQRLLVEARLQKASDEAGRAAAREALLQYLKLVGDDQVAQVRLIDLNARDLQTLARSRPEDPPGRIEYLQSVMAAQTVPAEVRSHAAMLLASTFAERGQDTEADEALDSAIKLNPLNAGAIRSKLQRLQAGSTPPQRLELLLQLIRANPNQPDVMARIGHELADNGVVDAAMNWFRSSFELSQKLGRGLNMFDYTDWAALMIVAGQPRDAVQVAEKILGADPGNGDAAFVRLIAQRRLATPELGPEVMTAAESAALEAVLRRVEDLHARITNTEPPPTTQPIATVNDFLVADAQKLKEGGDPTLYSQYISALARLAWYQLYFKHDAPGAAKALEAMHVLLPDTDPTINRLDGWSFLIQGNHDAARTKLEAVADRDPLSQLGMIELAEKEAAAPATQPKQGLDAIDPAHPGRIEHPAPTQQLIELSGTNASGLTGVILAEALRQRNAKFQPGPAAPALRAELDKFPREFLDFIDTPQNFYKLTAEPISVSHRFGEPILVRVTIQNISKFDLSLDADGAIRPDLWFDVRLVGLVQTALNGVAYERMAQRLVLKAKTGAASQIVRMDDGPLALAMAQQPVIPLPMQFSVFTNPVTTMTQQGANVGPGPGGYRVQFTRVIERAAAPMQNPQFQQTIMNNLTTGTPIERMRAASLFAAVAPMFANAQQPREAQQFGAKLFDQLQRAAAAPDDSPAAHATILIATAFLSQEPQRLDLMTELLRSPRWDSRMLGLRVLQTFPAARQKEVAARFADKDPDSLVKQYATTVLSTADIQPTTQPATTQPGALPAVPDASATTAPAVGAPTAPGR